MAASPTTIFERIDRLARHGPPREGQLDLWGNPRANIPLLRYRWQPDVDECIRWLQSANLTMQGRTYRHEMPFGLVNPLHSGGKVALGLPSHRAERRRKADLNALKKRYAEAHKGEPRISDTDLENIWRELKNPAAAVRLLDILRLPADALAFYRPFHFAPHEEWGIYLLLQPMMDYCETLHHTFTPLKSFNQETLMGCLLFEVFHHEFFHHLTECAATTLEIISASFGAPRPVLRNYWEYRFDEAAGLGKHPHHPLEEALANSYAYNSFSFLSRMQIGYKLAWLKLYQKVLEQCWPQEPAGYRCAGEYINDRYVSGATQLLAMLMESADLDPASLMLIAKTVMPNGNSAFLAKPDVPTYLVGDAAILAKFHDWIPAPNETYTSLFWLGDVSHVDKFLRERQKQETEQRKAMRLTRAGS